MEIPATLPELIDQFPDEEGCLGVPQARELRLLCRARQRGRRLSVLLLGGSPLAPIALAAQPEGKGAVVAHGAVPHPVDPSGSNPPSLARAAFRRLDPRQEPSALAAHAGICAGGGPKLHWPNGLTR